VSDASEEHQHPPDPAPTLRDRFFTAWANGVTARPVLVVLVCVLLAGVSVAYAARWLAFRSDRSELVDPSLDFQKRYADFRARFPRWDDAVIVVDTASARTPAEGEAYIAALESRLVADERFSAVSAGFTDDEAPPGLILTEPLERVAAHVQQMKRATVVITSPTLDSLLRLSLLGAASADNERSAQLKALLERAASAARGERDGVLALGGGVHRFVRPGGSLVTVLVALRHKATDSERIDSIRALREHLDALRSEPMFAVVQAGITGIPVLEADETAQSTRDGTQAGVLSLLAIVALMLVAYRGVVIPLLATASLLIGVAWAFAWATIAVGHLQLLSVTFATMLLGLGIDVAIHIIARVELVHPSHDDMRETIARVFRGVGPGIVTATLTVAVGAGAMALTPFSGVAEMGIIAAGGIALCTVAIMSTLPAMLMLLKDPARRLRARVGGESKPFLGRLGAAMHSHPRIIVAVACLLGLASLWGARSVGYDTDLQNLMPTGSESVHWQRRLEQDDARSVWHAVVLAKDSAEARELSLRLLALPEVGEVGGAGMLFQSGRDLVLKRRLLESLPGDEFYKSELGETPEPRPDLLRKVCVSLGEAYKKADSSLASAADTLAGLPDESLLLAMNVYENNRERLASTLLSLRDAAPVPPEQLPKALKDTMIAPDGSLLLRVYPKETAGGVLSSERLGPFARAVLGAVPNATGPTVQIFESTRLITAAYRDAALYALVAIVLVLLIDFRHLGDAACALIPVLLGAALLLGTMDAAGIALNLANLIVMPLIVGIGVGCGVHAVRRWRLQPSDPPPGLAGGSGRAVTLTTLTTVIGFATLILGEHRGIRSLGLVMSLGLVLVWAVTIFVLPAVLSLRAVPHVPNRITPTT